MALILRYILLFTPLVLLLDTVSASKSAWNGYSLPGSNKETSFTPYYVPEGAKSYDCTSKLLLYSGDWSKTHSPSSPVRVTCKPTKRGASMTFTFFGCGIEWFGSMGPDGGNANVLLDGKYVKTVDSRSDSSSDGQRIYGVSGLVLDKHIFTIRPSDGPGFVDIQAMVVSSCPPRHPARRNYASIRSSSGWKLVQNGTTGVGAMQLAVVSEKQAIIIDKVEHNPLTIQGHPAWGALLNLDTLAVTPLRMKSNSFCASGSFLGNGTLVNVGGNPVVADKTGAADFGDVDGTQTIRLFGPCDSDNSPGCEVYENPERIRMASPRWYSTTVRIDDGSVMIIGGSTSGGWMNNASSNNPTYEFYPPKDIHGSKGLPIHLPFLEKTLNSNLFPISFFLPDGNIFIAANRDATIYNWRSNTERRLPSLPCRVTYPMSGTGVLLPLSPDDGYAPQVLICGGSNLDDHTPSWEISSQDPASSKCSRILLTDEGISKGWEVENMPEPRIMPDAVILPTGKVLFVNGGKTGIAGYGNVKDPAGTSNSDNPVLRAVLYDPSAAPGQRFSSDLPQSDIPRLYHSVAALTPRGDIMIAGSNPNMDRSEIKYGTEYRIEWLSPPYMESERPEIVRIGKNLLYGENMTISLRGKGLVKRESTSVQSMLSSSMFPRHRLSFSSSHGFGFCHACCT